MACGAVYVRVNAGVVERTGDDRYRDRTCPATAYGPVEIAALPGRDAADDQPDGKNHGSEMHLDLLSILWVIYGEAANHDGRPLSWSGITEEVYPRPAIPSPVRASPMPFPGNWKLLARLSPRSSVSRTGSCCHQDRRARPHADPIRCPAG